MIYYHNPKCSKSREGLKIVEKINKNITVKLYLSENVTISEIKDIIKKLKVRPIDIVRKKEKIIKENGFNVNNMSDSEIIKMMADYPILIERPILVDKNKAVVGRPPELLKTILK